MHCLTLLDNVVLVDCMLNVGLHSDRAQVSHQGASHEKSKV